MVLVFLAIIFFFSESKSCNIANCLQCSSSSSKICLACESGYQPSLFGCHLAEEKSPVVIRNCLEIDENLFKCKKCQKDFHLFEGFCEADCFDHCDCFEPFECVEDLMVEDALLKRELEDSCSSNCEVCTVVGCTTCSTGYFLLSPFVCSKCEDNCKKCADKYVCTTCNDGYLIDGYNCAKCSSNCKTCYGSASKCYSCNDGMKLSGTSCISKDDDDGDDKGIAGTIVGIVFSIIFILVTILLIYCCIKRKWYIRCYACCCKRNPRSWLKKYYEKHPNITNDVNNKKHDVISIQPTGQSHQVVDMTHSNIYPQNNFSYAQNARGVQLNAANFNYEVKPITLDAHGKYYGQDFCLFCSNALVKENDQRVLPCGHVFHGRCAYDSIVIRGYKQCPVCKTQYA